ncbi:MAG TPA: AAA family ATPase [Burkholderiales bacterium]|nr:AAA family ATPase [Burkholderiales bacterium]
MRLDSFRLKNYRCFGDTETLSFGPGFNLVVGANSVGKSTLLEALSLGFPSNPTRSPRTQPRHTALLNPLSSAEIAITLAGPELRRYLLSENATFRLPMQAMYRDDTARMERLEHILSQPELSFDYQYSNPGEVWASETCRQFPEAAETRARFNNRADRTGFVDRGFSAIPFDITESLGRFAGNLYRAVTYRFLAQRMNIGKCQSDTTPNLASNAINLPATLNVMQSDRDAFLAYNKLVAQILPTVDHVSVIPIASGYVEILVWPHPTLRHLAVPLDECGTGVAQVLAILYVVMTSLEPRTIIIDEPNTFLHPGATRKLMEVLSDFRDQQYIVATHSPEVIKAIVPRRLMRIDWHDGESAVTCLDASDVRSMSGVLQEIGARVSDVMAADSIIWVDGESEELVFPLILRELAKKRMFGTAIVAVHDTGSFEKSPLSAGAIARLYQKLSKGGGLVPRAIGFSFDREVRTESEITELRSKYSDMHFLPRRMLENYLLDGDAIAFAIDQQVGGNGEVTATKVQDWITSKGKENKYFNPLPIEPVIFSEEWTNNVHAAKLLHDLFQDILDARAQFVKTRDNLIIVEWLILNRKAQLTPLCDYIKTVVAACHASVADVHGIASVRPE